MFGLQYQILFLPSLLLRSHMSSLGHACAHWTFSSDDVETHWKYSCHLTHRWQKKIGCELKVQAHENISTSGDFLTETLKDLEAVGAIHFQNYRVASLESAPKRQTLLWARAGCRSNLSRKSTVCTRQVFARRQIQSWALSVFLKFFNSKKRFFAFFFKVSDLFLHKSYSKSPLPVKLTL